VDLAVTYVLIDTEFDTLPDWKIKSIVRG